MPKAIRESKDCTHGYKGMRYRYGNLEVTSCPLCNLRAEQGTLRTPQYWLAELDQYDNPKLIDGSHDSAEGANNAAYLIDALGLGTRNRRFAVARVELSECVPSSKGVNMDAIRTLNRNKR